MKYENNVITHRWYSNNNNLLFTHSVSDPQKQFYIPNAM